MQKQQEIERRAIEEFARRHGLAPHEAERAWHDADSAIRAVCRLIARTKLRMAGVERDRMVPPCEVTNRKSVRRRANSHR